MVDLPGKTSVYILSTEFVMCARHAEKKSVTCEASGKKIKRFFGGVIGI